MRRCAVRLYFPEIRRCLYQMSLKSTIENSVKKGTKQPVTRGSIKRRIQIHLTKQLREREKRKEDENNKKTNHMKNVAKIK